MQDVDPGEDLRIESILFGSGGIQISCIKPDEVNPYVSLIRTYTLEPPGLDACSAEVDELIAAARELVSKAHVFWRNPPERIRG